MRRILQSIHTWGVACIRSVFRARRTEAVLAPLDTLPPTLPFCITRTPYTIYSLGRYDTRLWHALIYEIKFHASDHAVQLLAPQVQSALLHLITTTGTPCCVLPMPLYPARERERGYNQVSLVLNACPDVRTYVRTDMLVRTTHRAQQKTLNRTQREENVAHCFAVPAQARPHVAGVHIILVDDVCATGATVREAARTCFAAGAASVTIFAFCNS